MQKESEESPPDSSDLEGWRKAMASGRVAHFAPEALVAALQELGPGLEASIREAIGQRLNRMLMGWLRGHIGHNHPNGGEDIIVRTHFEILEAMLEVDSTDGKALREAFWARVSFRAKDAIAKEYRDSRIPLAHEPRKRAQGEEVPLDKAKAAAIGHLTELQEPEEEVEDVSGFIGEDAVSNTGHPGAALLEGLKNFEESMDVERVLAHIKHLDWRKRLAFRLHMQEVPFGSKKGLSIAGAVGRSSKTVEKCVRRQH